MTQNIGFIDNRNGICYETVIKPKTKTGGETMKVSNGLEMLNLPGMNGSGQVHPVVIWDGYDVILVDAGFPGQLSHIRDQMNRAGIPFNRLSKIIITHSDMDHIGSLRSILDNSTQKIEVLAHANEKPYIEGKLPPVRVAQMKANLKLLPEERRPQLTGLYERLLATCRDFIADVTRTAEDGEILPCCGGIRIVYTPGHTPGHISLYLTGLKTLIAGDLMNVRDGRLVPAPDFTTPDKKRNLQSMQKLTGLDIRTVVCYHGGLFDQDAGKRIAELAGRN